MTMKYQPERFCMWDAWCIQRGDDVHLFHLQGLKSGVDIKLPEEWGWGHAVSRDMVHWAEQPMILCPHGLPMDKETKYTGCTVEKDGVYYMFYTMREGCAQRIGLALSDDLYNWKEYEGNPVLVPDGRWFNTFLAGSNDRCTLLCWEPTVDCRDFLVISDPAGGYYGYVVAAADLGGHSPVGVIGLAHSDDLIHWEQRGVAFQPRWAGVVEMMDVFEMDGRYYMTMLTGANYGSRHCFSDDYVTRGEIYAVADTPAGPFLENLADNTFIGGQGASGYSCRTMDFQGQKRLVYVDVSGRFDNCVLTLPKTVRVTDGRLRPYYAADLLACIRKRRLNTVSQHLVQNSFAWPTLGGTWEGTDPLKGTAVADSWQACLFGGNDYSANVEIESTFEWDCKAFGFVFWGQGRHFDSPKLAVLVEPSENRLQITAPYGWEKGNYRAYDFSQSKQAHLRAILLDDTIEVYVNDELVLNSSCANPGGCVPGVFVDDGTVQVIDPKAWEIAI